MKEILKKQWLLYCITISLGVINGLVFISIAYIIGKLIDNISTGDISRLYYFTIVGGVAVLAYVISSILSSYTGELLSKRVLHNMKSKIYKRISNLPIYEYQKKDVSYYYNMLTHDIDDIYSNYIDKTYRTIIAILSFLMSLTALFWINLTMALIFIALTGLAIFVPTFLSPYQQKARNTYSQNYESFMKKLENILSGFESLKILNVSSRLFGHMTDEDWKMEGGRLKRSVTDGVASSIIGGFNFFVQLFCLLIGTYFVIKGHITTGALFMSIQILNNVFMPISLISSYNNLMKSTKGLRDKIAPYLVDYSSTGQSVEEGDISLRNISLKLGEKQVLTNFTYDFKKGNSYIIIGESGCGKSTIAKLISGFYADFNGDVLYGTSSSKDIDDNSIAQQIRYIGANTYVINDSLLENIRMYRDFSDEQIISVAEKVGFSKEMLSKKDLGHGGKFISSGEYQRIAIARAMVENPFCIILDEPTANLDMENTQNIQEIIKGLNTPIKIVISHDYDDDYLASFDHVLNMNVISK